MVCGDMNIAPTDEDVFDPAAYVGHTHVTAPERAEFGPERQVTTVPSHKTWARDPVMPRPVSLTSRAGCTTCGRGKVCALK